MFSQDFTKKFILLLKWEFKIQNKIHSFTKYLSIFLLFTVLSIILLSNQEMINHFGLILPIICIPLSLIHIINYIIKNDINDGTLELMLSSFNSYTIIIAKFISILLTSIIAILCTIPLIAIFLSLTINMMAKLILLLILLLISCISLSLLSSLMQAYFKSNTYFLSILTLPLITPIILMIGLIINNNFNFLIYVIIGINLILLPCICMLSSYLLKNIYNV